MLDSLESICEEFALPKNLSRTKLRAVLKKRVASIHADRTGGEFPNEAIKQLHLRMQEAMDFLDRPTQTRTNALEKRTRDDGAIETRIAALEVSSLLKDSSYDESAQRASKSAGHRYRGKMISSGVFATISGTILAFSQKLSENSVFSPIVGVPWVRFLVVTAFILSVLAFLLMRASESMLKRKVLALLSEDGIAWAVRECIYKYDDEPELTITQRKMAKAIGEYGVRWHKLEFVRLFRELINPAVPRDLAEKVAKLQISSLIERGIIRRDGTKGSEPLYVIDISSAKEIIDDHDAMLFEHKPF